MNRHTFVSVVLMMAAVGCGSSDGNEKNAAVQIKNDFNNPSMSFQPPWTICKSSYLNVEFGKLGAGETSAAKQVAPGLDYVLMVAAWNDPTCSPEKSLPLATKSEEEIVDGQSRTISINLANHQGACPPEGVAPIPEAQYSRILAMWPEFNFKPYAQRTQNAQCVQ